MFSNVRQVGIWTRVPLYNIITYDFQHLELSTCGGGGGGSGGDYVENIGTIALHANAFWLPMDSERAGGCRWARRPPGGAVYDAQGKKGTSPRGRREQYRWFSRVFDDFRTVFRGNFASNGLRSVRGACPSKTAPKSDEKHPPIGPASFAPILPRTNTASVFFMAVRPSASFE